MAAHQRQLVVAVEGTAALGQSWNLLRCEYIDKIARAFHGSDGVNQKYSGLSGEMALVVFYTHGPHSGCLLQQTGWTTNLDVFLQWLSCINFMGGGFGESAIAEGLAEALLMCCPSSVVAPVNQVMDRQKHCLLVAASTPHRLPTPVPRPAIHTLVQPSTTGESPAEQWWLADADAVAKAFPQCLVSLSVIAPRQLPMLKSIYNGGKRNSRSADSPLDPPKYPQHMVLLSESFMEARLALSRAPGTAMNSSSIGSAAAPKIEPVSLPAASVAGQVTGVNVRASVAPSALGTVGGRPSVSSGIVPFAAVKMEVSSVPALASGTGLTSVSLVQNSGSVSLSMQHPLSAPYSNQDQLQSSLATDTSGAQDFKNLVNNTTQPLRAVGAAAANVNLLTNAGQSRQMMGTTTLPGVNTLGIQSAVGAAAGMPMSGVMSSGSTTTSTIQSSLAIGQPPLGMNNNLVGLGGVGMGMGQGAVSVGLGGFSGTSNLVGSASLGAVQPANSGNTSIAGVEGVVGLGQAITGQGQGGLTGNSQLGQSGLGMGHNVLAGLGTAGVSSGGGTMIPTPGLPQQVQGLRSLGVAANSGITNTLQVPAPVSSVPNALQQVPIVATPPQQPTGTPSKYEKLWEGALAGQRQGKPVVICPLEAYRQATSPETLAADWPPTMQICRLIAQDVMNSKNYQGKSELLVFRPLSQHGFLVQLAEKKLCAVIQLPSQTLLLASSDKPGRMIGMLFPEDMVVLKPQLSNQQQQAQSTASGMGQTFSQGQLPGQTRPQMMQQGQLTGQGPASLSGTGFLP